MGSTGENSTNKFGALAVSIALVLHGLAGFGLANMKMLTIEPPKITPPIQIEMITINHEEAPEPPKPTPVVTPVAKPVSQPKAAAPLAAPAPKKSTPEPPKPVTKPKTPEPPKKTIEPIKPKDTSPTKPQKEPKPISEPKTQSDNSELLAQQQRQAAFEAQQKREREQQERERLQREKERQEQKNRELAEADAKRKAEEAEANAKRSKDGEGKGGSGNDKTSKNTNDKGGKGDNDKGGKGDDKGGQSGGVLTGQSLSISNASWRIKPNFGGIASESLSGQTVSFTVKLSVDAKGNITSVSGVSTGDRAVDRQISQAIRRAKMHPFKNANGQLMAGSGTLPMTVRIP